MNPLNPFAPPPQVVTVALNPALDHTLEVAGLQPGAVNRAYTEDVSVSSNKVTTFRPREDLAAAYRQLIPTPNAFASAWAITTSE